MSDQIWYLYQNGQQVGPFDTHQVSQLYLNNMIAKDGFIFKVGWQDWRPIEDGYEELGIKRPVTAQGMEVPEPIKVPEKTLEGYPRASIGGRVVVHNNGQLTIGEGVNISVVGIFVETSARLFTVGESLKLSVRCDGLPKAFNAEAIVIRYNTDEKFPLGYGLKFVNLDSVAEANIKRLVEEANSRGDRGRLVV